MIAMCRYVDGKSMFLAVYRLRVSAHTDTTEVTPYGPRARMQLAEAGKSEA